MIPRTLGPYRLAEQIAAGGMGVVFRATDRRDGSEVALKRPSASGPVRQEAAAAVRREIGVLARVRGLRELPDMVDQGEDAEGPWHATRYVAGESLRAHLARGPLPEPTRRLVALGLFTALRSLSERGIVHRDVRPENVHVAVARHVVLFDFGLAQEAGRLSMPGAGADTEAVRRTLRAGHAAYTAPEILAGTAGHAASDWFSFGALALELWTGERAFTRTTPVETHHAVATHDPLTDAARQTLPRDLRGWIEACLRKDPAEREAALARVGIRPVPRPEIAP